MSCVSQLLLKRRTLVQHLLDSTDVLNIPAPFPPFVQVTSQVNDGTEEFRRTVGFIVLENICRIMALNIDYYCTSTSVVIPVNEKNVRYQHDMLFSMQLIRVYTLISSTFSSF